jgi:UPF0755 protein
MNNQTKLIIIKIILLSTFIFVMVVTWSIWQYYRSINIGDKTVTVIIKQGDSLSRVCDKLISEGVVRYKLILKLPARFFSIDKKLTPGRYDFTGINSIKSVLERLEGADFLRLKVTIPEGNTIWETSALLAEKLELDSTLIHNLNNDSAFLDKFEILSLEGYLYPETYFLKWGIDEKTAVGEIIKMFKSQTDSLWQSDIIAGLSKEDIIILSSIIEAETSVKDERRLVSSVYHNRLKINMKLDADPTVIYGLGGLERPLYRKDLTKETPYNTYLMKGLPPTPINSPGIASISAALNPESTDYIFFVADEVGGHIFSKTLREHNNAINKIRNKR